MNKIEFGKKDFYVIFYVKLFVIKLKCQNVLDDLKSGNDYKVNNLYKLEILKIYFKCSECVILVKKIIFNGNICLCNFFNK